MCSGGLIAPPGLRFGGCIASSPVEPSLTLTNPITPNARIATTNSVVIEVFIRMPDRLRIFGLAACFLLLSYQGVS